jgi:predicted small lipoprotein YifL
MVSLMFNDRTFLRLALIGALVASLGLAACGRKGPLDPPPGASLASEPQIGAPGPLTSPIGGETRNNNAGVDSDGRVQAPAGAKKRIPLDALLN